MPSIHGASGDWQLEHGPANVVIAVDDSKGAQRAIEWALSHALQAGDTVHLACVLAPEAVSIPPSGPVSAPGAFVAWEYAHESQRKQEEEAASAVLRGAIQTVRDAFPAPHGSASESSVTIRARMLPGHGGASGVGESIVEYAHDNKATLVVLGCRGLGTLKRGLMALVGLGSVSDYAVARLHCPVAVIHHDRPIAPPENRARKICIACDESDHSKITRERAVKHFVRPGDEVHVVSVALPVPYPVVDEASPAVAAYESQQWQTDKDAALARAEEVCRAAVDATETDGVPRTSIWYRPLLPEGGASEVGQSIVHYCQKNEIDVLFVGSRGLSSVKRNVLGLLGLGSVSVYCVHQLQCAVIVCKHQDAIAAAGPAAAPEEVALLGGGEGQVPVPVEAGARPHQA
ncbi:unnamed protein product [Pedinophyceae sp. YPF-701]|nr:unnamed protein product [Pedinophyceae sp. YPF-701]